MLGGQHDPQSSVFRVAGYRLLRVGHGVALVREFIDDLGLRHAKAQADDVGTRRLEGVDRAGDQKSREHYR